MYFQIGEKKKKTVWRGYVKFDSNTQTLHSGKGKTVETIEKILGGKSWEGGGEGFIKPAYKGLYKAVGLFCMTL